jgi:hypothetical protein
MLAKDRSKLFEASIQAYRYQRSELNWGRSVEKLISALRLKISSKTGN